MAKVSMDNYEYRCTSGGEQDRAYYGHLTRNWMDRAKYSYNSTRDNATDALHDELWDFENRFSRLSSIYPYSNDDLFRRTVYERLRDEWYEEYPTMFFPTVGQEIEERAYYHTVPRRSSLSLNAGRQQPRDAFYPEETPRSQRGHFPAHAAPQTAQGSRKLQGVGTIPTSSKPEQCMMRASSPSRVKQTLDKPMPKRPSRKAKICMCSFNPFQYIGGACSCMGLRTSVSFLPSRRRNKTPKRVRIQQYKEVMEKNPERFFRPISHRSQEVYSPNLCQETRRSKETSSCLSVPKALHFQDAHEMQSMIFSSIGGDGQKTTCIDGRPCRTAAALKPSAFNLQSRRQR